MKRSIRKAVVALFLSVLLVLPLSASAADEVNIGIILPQTGRVAAIGIDSVHGAEIAAKEINDGGGLLVDGKKYTVKIRPYDDEASAAKAVAGMQKLKDKYDVPVILCGLSGPTMAMLERNERLGIIIMGYFKHPDATKGNKLVLRHQKTGTVDSKNLATAVAEKLKPKTYALISANDDYGKGQTAGYEPIFEQYGVTQVAKEWLDERSQTDFRGQLTKIKAANPDVIVLTAHDEASAGVIKQAHELGIKSTFALSLGFGVAGEKLTGPELIEGYLKSIEFTSKTPWPPANARYRQELYPAMGYKEPLAGFGINMYASVHIITRAMAEAGTTTDAHKIRAAVPKVVPLPEKHNTTGVTEFLENGDCKLVSEMGVFRDGKLVPLN